MEPLLRIRRFKPAPSVSLTSVFNPLGLLDFKSRRNAFIFESVSKITCFGIFCVAPLSTKLICNAIMRYSFKLLYTTLYGFLLLCLLYTTGLYNFIHSIWCAQRALSLISCFLTLSNFT